MGADLRISFPPLGMMPSWDVIDRSTTTSTLDTVLSLYGDVRILTIDGTKGAVQGIIDGWISGVIESNPRFGPLAFQALADFYSGTGVPVKTIISDKEYTKENAEAELPNAY